jgi:uncharacterized protein YdeI (YjbR/CyaY-like superfamily)
MASGATDPDRQGLPILPFVSRAAWSVWLAANHDTSKGLWLKIAKAASGNDSVTYAEAVDAALCHGWIDGQKGAYDEAWWLQRFTPRGPRSKWSKINCGKAEALIASGQMRAAGLAEVERAKADGRWAEAYDSQRTATVPDDLAAALDANPAAGTFFQDLNGASRYAILYRISDAKRPATRAQRIEKFVEMLARGEAPHLFGGPAGPGSSTGPSAASH